MIREELLFFSEPNEKLTNYVSGVSTITFDTTTKEWTISNPSGASVYLQYTTEKDLNIGDMVEVEFTGTDNNAVSIGTKTELVGGGWQDGYSMDNRLDNYSSLKRAKLPIKKKGKHKISIGLGSATTGTVKVKNIKIKIQTDTPNMENSGVDKLYAKLLNNTTVTPAVWEHYSYQTTGDTCTITPYGSYGLTVTFNKALKNKGNAFVSVEGVNNGVRYKVLAQESNTNRVNLMFYNSLDNTPIRPADITDKLYVSVLLM